MSSPIILPDIAILDPDLTLGLPAHITAATGIDAMVHAIEAYASKSANNNPLSKMLARQALQLLGSNIEKAVFDGKDRAARGAMLLGSMLAGQAFANSPVAAVHALAYPIGGTFHIPHGLSTRSCSRTSCGSMRRMLRRYTRRSQRTFFRNSLRNRETSDDAPLSSSGLPGCLLSSAFSRGCGTWYRRRAPGRNGAGRHETDPASRQQPARGWRGGRTLDIQGGVVMAERGAPGSGLPKKFRTIRLCWAKA
ncbi:Hypothetical protein NGAL_HAMBI2610_52990 [Neorhizobium galegae bv. orientalis]|nr:Hypothetical protein NGAL_HAMBI2610_52990 [Neorhizobium galegae bv. orientalis]